MSKMQTGRAESSGSSTITPTEHELSQYVQHLTGDSRRRYIEKCAYIGRDPYILPSSLFKEARPDNLDSIFKEDIPDFDYPDLCNYLIYKLSYYTGKELKSYKGLEAYNQMTQGWITYLGFWKVPGKNFFLVMSKVLHSQAISNPPLRPWVIIEKAGEVETAHCTCMAGLGEACTHIAATLFAVQAIVKSIRDRTCTSQACYWLGVSGSRVEFAEGSNIDFTGPARKKLGGDAKQPVVTSRDIPLPTSQENSAMYDRLKATGFRSAVLSIVPKYAVDFAPKSVALGLPDPLNQLYSAEWAKQDYPTLLRTCEEVIEQITLTREQSVAVEEATRDQAKNKMWFQQRAGRITASRFKAACRTDPANPSVSLIKQVCYPDSYTFSTKATRHGCQHEDTARAVYQQYLKDHHTDPNITASGLLIHSDYPFLGASPDGCVSCTCCGSGIIEIKCPFCLKNKDAETTAVEKKNFCLRKSADNHLFLDENHAYYYQVQLQLLLSEKDYCDFVVWRQTEEGNHEIFIQRLVLDKEFIDECVSQARMFYIHGVLPELLGKWYSRPRSGRPAVGDVQVVGGAPCYCKDSTKQDVLFKCQSGFCKIRDFHQSCLGLKTKPKRNWFCPDCRTVSKKKRAEEE